jgi:hypothetical protein
VKSLALIFLAGCQLVFDYQGDDPPPEAGSDTVPVVELGADPGPVLANQRVMLAGTLTGRDLRPVFYRFSASAGSLDPTTTQTLASADMPVAVQGLWRAPATFGRHVVGLDASFDEDLDPAAGSQGDFEVRQELGQTTGEGSITLLGGRVFAYPIDIPAGCIAHVVTVSSASELTLGEVGLYADNNGPTDLQVSFGSIAFGPMVQIPITLVLPPKRVWLAIYTADGVSLRANSAAGTAAIEAAVKISDNMLPPVFPPILSTVNTYPLAFLTVGPP